MTASATPVDGALEVSSATQLRVEAVAAGELCPRCRTPRISGDRFCEVDGYDFDDPSSTNPVWCVIVVADRARFDQLAPDDLVFPDNAPTLTHTLGSDSVSVGRRSRARAVFPDIDLGGTYEDPSVSREHLRFERSTDGTYAVVDWGSANGTTMNDDPVPITPRTPVPLADGDRIHLGAWTTITVCLQPEGASTG